MENETQKTTETKSKNPLLEESRALAERMEKAAAEAKAQADRLEQLRSEQLLSGTAGIRPNIPQLNEDELRKKRVMEFWKDTTIAQAIEKYG